MHVAAPHALTPQPGVVKQQVYARPPHAKQMGDDEYSWAEIPSNYPTNTGLANRIGSSGAAGGLALSNDGDIGASVSHQIIAERLVRVSVTVLSRLLPSLHNAQLAQLRDGQPFENTFLLTCNLLAYYAPLVVIFYFLTTVPLMIRITIQTYKYIGRCCKGGGKVPFHPPKSFRKKLE